MAWYSERPFPNWTVLGGDGDKTASPCGSILVRTMIGLVGVPGAFCVCKNGKNDEVELRFGSITVWVYVRFATMVVVRSDIIAASDDAYFRSVR